MLLLILLYVFSTRIVYARGIEYTVYPLPVGELYVASGVHGPGVVIGGLGKVKVRDIGWFYWIGSIRYVTGPVSGTVKPVPVKTGPLLVYLGGSDAIFVWFDGSDKETVLVETDIDTRKIGVNPDSIVIGSGFFYAFTRLDAVKVIENANSYTTTIPDLLGIPRTCFYQLSGPSKENPGWVIGVIDAPTCKSTTGWKPIKKFGNFIVMYERNGTVIGFTPLWYLVLEETGHASTVVIPPGFHVYPVVYVPGSKVYLANGREVKIINAVDSTIEKSNETYCVIPPGKKSIDTIISWKPIETKHKIEELGNSGGTIKIREGELILIKIPGQNMTIVCHGDLSYTKTLLVLDKPSYREFAKVVTFKGSGKLLAIYPDGYVEVITPKNPFIKIRNGVIIAGSVVSFVSKSMFKPIYMDPLFILSIPLMIIVLVVVVMKPSVPPRDTITLVLDFVETPPLKPADEAELVKEVERFIDKYGYCPSISDISLSVLPSPDVLKNATYIVTQNEIYTPICPFDINPKVEYNFYKLARVLTIGLFRVTRISRNLAIAESVARGQVFRIYIYLIHKYDNTLNILSRALREMTRVYRELPSPGYPINLGVIYVVENITQARELTKLLERYIRVDENGRKFIDYELFVNENKVNVPAPDVRQFTIGFGRWAIAYSGSKTSIRRIIRRIGMVKANIFYSYWKKLMEAEE